MASLGGWGRKSNSEEQLEDTEEIAKGVHGAGGWSVGGGEAGQADKEGREGRHVSSEEGSHWSLEAQSFQAGRSMASNGATEPQNHQRPPKEGSIAYDDKSHLLSKKDAVNWNNESLSAMETNQCPPRAVVMAT